MIYNELTQSGIFLIALAIVWGTFWKIIAVWHAARKGKKIWFFILFFVNTIGILDLFYLFYVEKVKTNKLFK